MAETVAAAAIPPEAEAGSALADVYALLRAIAKKKATVGEMAAEEVNRDHNHSG